MQVTIAALASKQLGWGSLLGQIMPLMQNCASSGKLPKSPPYAQYFTVLPACMSITREAWNSRRVYGKQYICITNVLLQMLS